MDQITDQILTRKEVSTMLKVPIWTLDYLVGTGQIPFSRLGKRSVRFNRDRILEWFKDREGVEFRHKKRVADKGE